MPPFVVALVVNDTLFATIVGASFTACLALMAWIVKSLIVLTSTVSDIDKRVGTLENQNGQHAPQSRASRT